MATADDKTAQLVTSIEGITEYRLANGTRLLLFPDGSKSKVTVNMTVFVGSRHEGYGEAGMAHLLEHMLFKGTPSHPEIPKALQRRGADFNGTTWLDRTNYYETLPAADTEQAAENLEFALRLEADRLVNSFVSAEDLASEMSVVRSEFERGENDPRRVLLQRVQAAAYDWHNYGRTTIGNLSDIERVPAHRLKAFYQKFYRPDNILLVIAGHFEVDTALEFAERYFGTLSNPHEPLDDTYTTEPAQDGERSVVLRRVGNSQLVAAAYHVPSGVHDEFAVVEMLAYIFGTEPAGRLHQSLVKSEIASSSSTICRGQYDPGLILFYAQLPTSHSIEATQAALLSAVEGVADRPITQQELTRAQAQFAKDRELRATDTQQIAIELSEWAAQGDWRLYFLFRDRVESVTVEQCTETAKKYLTRNNRTLGLFLPSEASDRVPMPEKPDLNKMLADYQGRDELQAGEQFDSAPLAIESRTERGQLNTGLNFAWLPKKTRGESVHIEINLRYGNEGSLVPFVNVLPFFPQMLLRGTRRLDHEQLQDRLDELRVDVHASGTIGLCNLCVETKRQTLPELLPLIGEMLREPCFDPHELEILKRQAITNAESHMTEPGALASLAVQRALAPYGSDNLRYVPTLEERIERYRTVTSNSLMELHATQLSAAYGEITAVGDFDPAELSKLAEDAFANWRTEVDQARINTPAQCEIPGSTSEIETPDKENAVFYAGMHIRMRDDHPQYPPLLVGNYIFGAGALSSRLGDRVRARGTVVRSRFGNRRPPN